MDRSSDKHETSGITVLIQISAGLLIMFILLIAALMAAPLFLLFRWQGLDQEYLALSREMGERVKAWVRSLGR